MTLNLDGPSQLIVGIGDVFKFEHLEHVLNGFEIINLLTFKYGFIELSIFKSRRLFDTHSIFFIKELRLFNY